MVNPESPQIPPQGVGSQPIQSHVPAAGAQKHSPQLQPAAGSVDARAQGAAQQSLATGQALQQAPVPALPHATPLTSDQLNASVSIVNKALRSGAGEALKGALGDSYKRIGIDMITQDTSSFVIGHKAVLLPKQRAVMVQLRVIDAPTGQHHNIKAVIQLDRSGKNVSRVDFIMGKKWAGILGQGAFGTVKRGFRWIPKGNRIKGIAQKVETTQDVAATRAEAELVRKHLKGVGGVPGVHRVTDLTRATKSGEIKTRVRTTMELCSGGDVEEAIEKGQLSRQKQVEVVVSASKTLQQIHARGVVHSDLKPSNMLITEDGHVKISDFGRATYVHDTEAQFPGGDVRYLPPEAIGQENVNGLRNAGQSRRFSMAGQESALNTLEQLGRVSPGDRAFLREVIGKEPSKLSGAQLRQMEMTLDRLGCESLTGMAYPIVLNMAAQFNASGIEAQAKANQVMDQLRNPHLTAEQRTHLQQQFSNYQGQALVYSLKYHLANLEMSRQQTYHHMSAAHQALHAGGRQRMQSLHKWGGKMGFADVYAQGVTYLEIFGHNPPMEFQPAIMAMLNPDPYARPTAEQVDQMIQAAQQQYQARIREG